MVGVQEDINCPRCKYKRCTSEFETRTGDTWICCSRCGYTLSEGKENKPDGAFEEFPYNDSKIFSSSGTYLKKSLKSLITYWKKSIEDKSFKEVTYTYKKWNTWMIKRVSDGKEMTFEEYEIAGRI